MDEQTCKIKVKVGDNELELEGPRDLVNDQYKAFLEAIKPRTDTVITPQTGSVGLIGVEAVTAVGTLTATASTDRDSLKRVFAEKEAVISLLALPHTENPEADALLLLLYGYQELRQTDYPVTGVRLMQAAKQSGLHAVDRIDRNILVHKKYVLAAGARRGRKYSLNNQGIAKAQEIIKEILD